MSLFPSTKLRERAKGPSHRMTQRNVAVGLGGAAPFTIMMASRSAHAEGAMTGP